MHIHEVLDSKPSREVVSVAPDTTVRELLEILAEHNIGAVVVSAEPNAVTGIVSERDVVRRLNDGVDVLDAPVSRIMSADVSCCTPEDTVDTLMRLMTERRVRHVPVLDDGRLVGLVSIGDVVKSRIGELEFERDQLNSYVSGAQ